MTFHDETAQVMNKFLPLVLFAVIVGFLYVGLGQDSRKLPSPLIGKQFPNVMVEDFHSNQQYAIQTKFQNTVSLVNIWASWCVTCRAEHRLLNAISQTGEVNMIGINYKDSKAKAKQFLRHLGNPFQTIVFDEFGKLGLELGVYATPETFLVDKQGVIRFKYVGQITQNIWKTDILPLIRQLKTE